MISPELEISLNLAVSEASRRGHEFVTVEHILYALLLNDSAAKALRACGANIEVTRQYIEDYFVENYTSELLSAGQMPQPTLAFQRVIQRAAQHVRAAGKDQIGGDNLLVSIFSERESFAVYFLKKQNITRFDVLNYIAHGVAKSGVDFDEDTADGGPRSLPSGDDDQPSEEEDAKSSVGEEEAREGRQGKEPLKLYTVDLVARARAGKIDPLIGRAAELERTVQVLCRRRKNNPLYVGDAGVGKTAIAEGLALRIADGKVPEPLKDAEIYSLDMGSLLAGSRFRGDFEQRLKGVLKALKDKPHAVLFIDEIHTLIGAGAASGGTLDASNLLKPALSSGQLKCIGATTFTEYRGIFENDGSIEQSLLCRWQFLAYFRYLFGPGSLGLKQGLLIDYFTSQLLG